jgi:hypothetical protein
MRQQRILKRITQQFPSCDPNNVNDQILDLRSAEVSSRSRFTIIFFVKVESGGRLSTLFSVTDVLGRLETS